MEQARLCKAQKLKKLLLDFGSEIIYLLEDDSKLGFLEYHIRRNTGFPEVRTQLYKINISVEPVDSNFSQLGSDSNFSQDCTCSE